jgi:hypothetical protein
MGSVPSTVGMFFGQVDKRPKGSYWTDSSSVDKKAAVGPFETKEQVNGAPRENHRGN